MKDNPIAGLRMKKYHKEQEGKQMSANNFIHGFNITVESERKEMSNMIDDLLKIEKKNNINQALVTKFSSECDEYQKKLDQIDELALLIENANKRIREKI